MGNNTIGSLIIDLGLETARLRSDTRKASNHFNSFEKRAARSLKKIKRKTESATKAMTAFGLIAGGVATAGLIKYTNAGINAADKIGKLSTRLGASTEALSEYKHVAELSGIKFDTLTMGWQRMTRRVAEAASGFGEARGALKELNLSAEELNQLRPEQQFEIIADSLNEVTNQADKVRLSMKLFDSEGVSLIQTMSDGSKGLREMRADAVSLGMSLSKEQTKGAEDANDAITRLKATTSALSIVLASELAVPIKNIADELTNAAIASGGFEKEIKAGVKGALLVTADLLEGIDKTVSYFDSHEGLATTGIIGYMVFGKKGLLAVAAGQIVIDKVAQKVKELHDLITGFNGNGLTVDTSKLENAQKRLVILSKQYNEEVERGLDGTKKGLPDLATQTLKQLNQQKMRVSGMILLNEHNEKNNKGLNKTKSLMESIVESLRGSANLTEKIQAKTENGLIAKPPVVSPAAQDVSGIDTGFIELQERLKTEEQILAESHLKRQNIINLAEEQGIESIVSYDQLRIDTANRYEQEITDIAKQGFSERQKFQAKSGMEQTRQVLGDLTAMTAGVSNSNRKMFELNKAAGIATAILNTYKGASESLGAYPQPLAGIMASAHIAAGFAQVSAIKNTSFNSKSASTPNLSGGGITSGTTQDVINETKTSAESNITNVYLEGVALGDDEVRRLVVDAVETARNNDELRAA